MQFDLLAGAHVPACRAPLMPASIMVQPPRVLVFDSGLGGLTVFCEVARAWPGAQFIYVADDAGFPYGRLGEAALVARVLDVMGVLLARHTPDVVVVACNTASTLVMRPLRARFPDVAFVGTVPAIKPAAAASCTKMFSVLATPGTVARDYTKELVREYAGHCAVTLVGAVNLAGLAERFMQGEAVPDPAVLAEIAPCFVESAAGRTDTVVLACTHYPLLMTQFRALAPWPVAWIDPAPAIARRAAHVLGEVLGFVPGVGQQAQTGVAYLTSGAQPGQALKMALRARGLDVLPSVPIPLR